MHEGMAVQRGVNLADAFRSIINGHNGRLGAAASVRSVRAAAITLGGSSTSVHESRWVCTRCQDPLSCLAPFFVSGLYERISQTGGVHCRDMYSLLFASCTVVPQF